MPRKARKKVPSLIIKDLTPEEKIGYIEAITKINEITNEKFWYEIAAVESGIFISPIYKKEENKMKVFKIYNFNAILEEPSKDIELSFHFQGVNKPEIFVQVFMTAKLIIEGYQNKGTWFDYWWPLTQLVWVIIDALKKSK